MDEQICVELLSFIKIDTCSCDIKFIFNIKSEEVLNRFKSFKNKLGVKKYNLFFRLIHCISFTARCFVRKTSVHLQAVFYSNKTLYNAMVL